MQVLNYAEHIFTCCLVHTDCDGKDMKTCKKTTGQERASPLMLFPVQSFFTFFLSLPLQNAGHNYTKHIFYK